MQVAGEGDSTENYEGKGDMTYYHGVSARQPWPASDTFR